MSGIVSTDDPQLGPLTGNGGATPTHLPAATSPLGGLVPAAGCPLATDQRGVARPQGPACDAGAVEISEAVGVAPITGTPHGDLLSGTPGPDLIEGLAGSDVLFGLGGDDELRGGPGNDVLIGGPGNDHLLGGPGKDVIFADAQDTVVDGGPGKDLCWLPGKLLPADC